MFGNHINLPSVTTLRTKTGFWFRPEADIVTKNDPNFKPDRKTN